MSSSLKRQREITAEMKAHVNADETCLITAKTVLGLAKRAKEIFISSKMPEKQQLLNFVFLNLKLGKKLLVTLRSHFWLYVQCHINQRISGCGIRTYDQWINSPA